MAPKPIPAEVLHAAWEALPATGPRTLRTLREALRRVGCSEEDLDAYFAPAMESLLSQQFGGWGCAHCRANWLRSWRPDPAAVARVIREGMRRHDLIGPEDDELARRVEETLHGARKLWACAVEGIITERELATSLLARAIESRSCEWAALTEAEQEAFIAEVEQALFPPLTPCTAA